jgi:hypothetical protein
VYTLHLPISFRRFVGFVMGSPEVVVAISSVAFGGVIGVLSGYSVRAYISFLHRRERLPLESLYRLIR